MYTLQLKVGSFMEYYKNELERIGERGIEQILESGKRWNISEELRRGGSAIFPHADPISCGDQIAAVVHGCLDSGADRVLVLGVYHHHKRKDLLEARRKEFEGEDISQEPSWGIFDYVEGEYSLFMFKALWDAEVKRRGIRAPHLVMRYPHLVNRSPEKLLGIEELVRLAKDSVVVATSDLCHHGVIYSKSNAKLMQMDDEGVEYAKESISSSLRILEQGDYRAFYDVCFKYLNDGKDSLSVLRYLKGAQKATILDLRLLDTSIYYVEKPSPSWVATSLVTLT